MIEWFPVLVMWSLFAVSLILVQWLGRRLHWSVEWSRKVIHLAMGGACVSFPWVFQNAISVWVLASCCVVLILCVRIVPVLHREMGGGLFAVSRVSFGDLLFAPAVALVFQWSDHRLSHYLIPVLLLTMADAAGALVGVRYGVHGYQARRGRKSLEGSFAFFVTAFLVVLAVELCDVEQSRTSAILIAWILACLSMMVEAIADRGFDNLSIPVVGFILYDQLLHMSPDLLWWRALVLLLLLCLLWRFHGHSSLTGGALVASILLSYACYVIVGWRAMLPLLLIFSLHLWVIRRNRELLQLQHGLTIVAALALPVCLCLLCYQRQMIDEKSCHEVLLATAMMHIGLMSRATVYRLSLKRHAVRDLIKTLIGGVLLCLMMQVYPSVMFVFSTLTFLLVALFLHERSLRSNSPDGMRIVVERTAWCVVMCIIVMSL